MRLQDIRNSVASLDGVGRAAAAQLSRLGIFSVADLLMHYPRGYEDRTRRVPLKDWQSAPRVQTVARVTEHQWIGYGKMRTVKVYINDGTGTAALVAFNRPFMEKSLPAGSIVSVTGAFFLKYGELQSSSFEAVRLKDVAEDADVMRVPLPESGILPVYRLTGGLQLRSMRRFVRSALRLYAAGVDTELPQALIQKRSLLQKKDALRLIHFPPDSDSLEQARRTIIYEELFLFECGMARRLYQHRGSLRQEPQAEQDIRRFADSLSPLQSRLLPELGFELSDGQKGAVMQMNADIDRGCTERNDILLRKSSARRPYTMSRLLQADVGAGKTVTALFACLRVIDWGGQCALMAPTELLAAQHAESASRLLGPLGVSVAFLTGNVRAGGRRPLLAAVADGSVQLLVGTHALFSRDVRYKDLQLAVIDEQHRFGVLQRNLILEKGRSGAEATLCPHLLMMSATPIPQSLALTVFGDLDITEIRTLPSGRKPVRTYLTVMGNERNVYSAVARELAAGHQAYFVYPRIEDAAPEQGASGALKSAEEMYEYLSRTVYPGVRCALLHSKIDETEQVRILHEFSEGDIKLLVATTVVEVGVDVANATCMVIEHADRFGLAELHQLRGRVGRGTAQSYCFLIYSRGITQAGIARMRALRSSTDGFFIAEQDLKLRGPGELQGLAQSGNMTLGLADFARDTELLAVAREDAFAAVREEVEDNSAAARRLCHV